MFQVTHGLQDKAVVPTATEAGELVVRALAEGKTNILVSRVESNVTVTQIDRPKRIMPEWALCVLRFDVTVPRR